MSGRDEHYVKPLREQHVAHLVESGLFVLEPVVGRRATAKDEYWIYFVQGEDGGPIKIGRTRESPNERIAALQFGYPFARLRLVGLLRGPGALEADWHRHFAAARMLGEWFRPVPELVEFIEIIQDVGPFHLFSRAQLDARSEFF